MRSGPANGNYPPSSTGAQKKNQAKPETAGQWLAGMAAAILAPPKSSQTPGQGGTPPYPGAPAGPGAAHGALAGESGMPAEPGMAPGGYLPPGQQMQQPGARPQAKTQKYEPGSPEYAANQVVMKMQSGTMKGLDALIADDIKDEILVPLRDGTATAAQIKKAQELVSTVTFVHKSESRITTIFDLRNAAGKIVTITTRRNPKSGDYEVVALNVKTPRSVRLRNARKKRRQQRQGGAQQPGGTQQPGGFQPQ